MITDVTMAQGWYFCHANLAAKVALVRRMGTAWLQGTGWKFGAGTRIKRPLRSSLARYRDRRSLSQACNEAISEIVAELYSAKDASYSKR